MSHLALEWLLMLFSYYHFSEKKLYKISRILQLAVIYVTEVPKITAIFIVEMLILE